jgi:hypothetical protein
MTLQEKDLLTRFLQQMIATRAGPKDAEADALIREAVTQQPDATYLLVQRAMQLEQMLEATEAHAKKLQSELDAARFGSGPGAPSGGFLSDPTWGSQPARSAASAQASAQAPGQQRSVSGLPIGAAPAAPAAAPAAAARPGGWGGGSMLGTVATTAAGVVAGSFLFQGIQGLMHRNDNTAADQHHNTDQQSLADSSHTAGSLYEEPVSDNLNNLADIEDTDSFASSDDGGGDYA